MIIKNTKTTRQDRQYHSEQGKIAEAANRGKLGRGWYRWDAKKREYVLSPKRNVTRL